MSICLECKGINFKYPGTGKKVFNDLSFSFSGSGFHAIFGPSGVGKTSLAHILSGRLQAEAGEVLTDGIQTMLYCYNMERLPGWSSVGRHLERITPTHNTDKSAELVKVFGMAPLLKRRFSQLSMGQQNRVNLLRYLVQDFQLLVMDESLANVDEKTRNRILLTIKEMFPQVIFICISHNVVEVAKFCRDIWVLRGSPKLPQAVLVNGQDYRHGVPLNQEGLQKTMLEIMNAA